MIEGLEKRREGRRGGRRRDRGDAPARKVDYRSLRHPFPAVPVFSEDRVEAIHDMALRTLEDLGIKILLPEAARSRARRANSRSGPVQRIATCSLRSAT